MIKCVLFDLDGVLVDACEWHYAAFNKSLKKVSGYEISREDHETTYNGLPTKVKLDILAQKNLIKENDKKDIWEQKQKFTIDVIQENASLDLVKVELLSSLKKKGLLVGCVTNSINKTANLMLSKTGQLNHLDLLITNEDVVHSKPDPEGYVSAMKKLSVAPAEVLIVEDSDKGYEAAINSMAHVHRVKNAAEVNLDTISNKILSINGGN